MFYIVGFSDGYNDIFFRMGILSKPFFGEIPKDAECLMFTGGEDVSPELYGEAPHPMASYHNFARDEREKEVFEEAVRRGLPMVGICRGAQFLAVMNKDALHQHIGRHLGTHLIYTKEDPIGTDKMLVSSTHHQMIKLLGNKPGRELLAWACQGSLENNQPEPEVVIYRNTKCLCIQFHPEYMKESSPGAVYATKLIEKLLAGEL